MEVGVCAVWHVVVEHNIDLLDIDASSKDLGGNEDAVLKRLESLVDFDSEFSSLDFQYLKAYLSSWGISRWMALLGMAFFTRTSASLIAYFTDFTKIMT